MVNHVVQVHIHLHLHLHSPISALGLCEHVDEVPRGCKGAPLCCGANRGLPAARAQAHENATLAEQAYAAGDHARAVEFHKVAAKAYLAGQERTDDEAVRPRAPRAPARAA